MVLVLGLITSLATQILKGLVAKWGTLAVQAMVLVVTVLVAWAYTYWGDALDWTTMALVFATAFGWYEVLVKRIFPTKK